MQSLYYLCNLINENVTKQKLDEYEMVLNFRPVFIELDDAIENNEKLIPLLNRESKRWTVRDTLVLKELKNSVY